MLSLSMQEEEPIHGESGWVKCTTPVPVAQMTDVGIQQEALKVVRAYNVGGILADVFSD